MNGFYRAGEWVIRLVYANCLWLIFTLLGLGLFGLMPATIALFSLLRRWIMGHEDVAPFHLFKQCFRQEFFKANGIGLLFLAIGYMLRMDILYFKSSSDVLFQLFLVLMLGLGIVYFIVLLHFFPVYVHFDVPFLHYFKYALIIGVTQLSSTLMMVIGSIALFCLYWYFSGLIPLFCVSLVALNLMWFNHRAVKKIEYEQAARAINIKNE